LGRFIAQEISGSMSDRVQPFRPIRACARLALALGLVACSTTANPGGDPGTDGDTASSDDTNTTQPAFRGVWASTPSGLNRFEADGDALVFLTIGATESADSWASALANGVIALGDPWLDDIRPEGDGYAASALWRSGTESQGVTEVAWDRDGFVTFSADGESMYVDSTSPFTGTSATGTLVRE
jgi:hypothetical protein